MSKYDGYWKENMEKIEHLLDEAYRKGESSKFEINEILEYGDRGRSSRYASITFSKEGRLKGNASHANALVKLLKDKGILEKYGDTKFRLKISRDLELKIFNKESEMKHTEKNKDDQTKKREFKGTLDRMDDDELWKKLMKNPKPLFKTKKDSITAVFDDRGFFFSKEAKKKYDEIKSEPHIYAARKKDGDYIYIGISNQSGGRWKRSHAYHLGGLAHEILDTLRYDDQNHSHWVDAWFKDYQGKSNRYHNIRLKQKVLISFYYPGENTTKDELERAESRLISMAERKGLDVLNIKR